MSESKTDLKRRKFCGVTMGAALPALGLISSSPSHAGGRSRGRSRGRSNTFNFYKLLETNPTGPEPFTRNNKAYWYGAGSFNGSRKVYQVEVTLPFDRKFPGFGLNKGEHESFSGMGVITPTQMTYRLTRRNERPIEIVFKGGANLGTGHFFLHNGTVTPVAGWPGAYDCPVAGVTLPNPAPSSFSFVHNYDLRRNITMTGKILPVPVIFPNAGMVPWVGTVANPCGGGVIPSRGPRYIEGAIAFPRGRPRR